MSTLLEKLIRTDAIPSPPGTALEIVRLNQNEDVDIDALVRVVERDPAIVAKVLKMANSSGFGRPGQIVQIRHAIVTLGLRSVNMLALSFSVVGTATGKNEVEFDYPSFWASTAVTTTAARQLALEHLPSARDESFLAGLLCNFSQLVLAECAPQEYGRVLRKQRKSGEPLECVERRILDTDHAQLGGELLSQWGLPSLITEAIAIHHDEERLNGEEGPARELGRVLHLAGQCALIYSAPNVEPEIDKFVAAAHRYYGMDLDACREFLEEINHRMPEIIELLALKQVDPMRMAEARMNATNYLVKESLALNQQMHAVTSSAKQLQDEKDELETRATTDPLTGLRNRGFFDETMLGELERSVQSGHSLGLLILDLDHFKSVNDTYGHQCGDEMLKAIAAALQHATTDQETVCRYGGEEIAIVCPGSTAKQLQARAEALRAAIEDVSVRYKGETIRRTASIGGCWIERPQRPDLSAQMIEAADAELYRAKADGRNRSYTKVIAPT